MENIIKVLYILGTCVLATWQQTILDIAPEFTKEPTSQFVNRGSRVKLKCAYQPKEGDVRWLFNGTPLNVQRLEQLQMSLNNGHLIIESFRGEEGELSSHVGNYQCEVTTKVGTILSKTASLQLPDIKDFRQRFSLEVRSPRDGEAFIPCEAPESHPAAVVTYLKNGEPLSSSSDHYRVLPSGHLHIIDVTDDDAGNYSCMAENPVSRVRVSYRTAIPLKVEDVFQDDISPIIVHHNGDMVHRGTSAMLECGCIGKPIPQVRWERIDGEFPERTERHGSTLIIHDVAVKDAGIYRCIAENGVTGDPSYADVELKVIKTPSIKKEPKDNDVIPGDTATFRCIVGRATEDDIRWYFNGKLLVGNVDKYTISGGELVVRSVTMADLGMYQCIVETVEGSVQAAARMKLNDGYPKIIGKPQDTTAIEGEMVTMLCEIHGSPLPTVGWADGSGTKVISSERMKVTEESRGDLFIARLMIFNVGQHDVGNFTCTAKNKLGKARATASLMVIPLSYVSTTTQNTKTILNPPYHHIASDAAAIPTSAKVRGTPTNLKPEVPAKPTKPQLYKLSETSVLIRWNHTQSLRAPLLGYRVQYRNVRTQADWSTVPEMVSPNEMSFTVEDLDKDIIYRFRIVAVGENNLDSISDMSNRFLLSGTQTLLTPPPVVHIPSPPRLTSCTPIGMDKIRVDWEYEPEHPEGPISGFYIYLRLTDSDDDRDYVRTPIIGEDIRMYFISKLEPEVSYDIKMTTFTDSGESEYSNVVIESTLAQVTDPPTIIIPKPVTKPPGSNLPTPVPDEGGPKENMLYIALGVVLGAMMLLMVMFLAMCFLRSKHVGEVKNMRYISPDLQHTMYSDGSYTYAKTHNGSLPHFHESNGAVGYKNRKAQSASQLMWTETRPLYTMPQDTIGSGGPVLPYQTVPSTGLHLYSPLTPCKEAVPMEVTHATDQQLQPASPVDDSIPSLRSISHNSLGPRPVCRIKRCRIPDEDEMRRSPLLTASQGRPSCSGDDSETGSLSLKMNMDGYIKPSGGLSIPSMPPNDDRASNCSRPRSASNQSSISSHHSNVHSDSSQEGSHHSYPVSIHSNSSVVTDV